MITAYKWYCIARSNTIGSSAGVKIDIKHFRILAHVSVDWGNVVLTVQETNLTEDITGSLRLRKNGNSWYLDVKISQSYKEESIEVSLYDNDHYDWYSYTDNELSGSTICLIEDVASVVAVQNADNLWAVNADGDLYPKDKEDGTPRNIISYGGISFGGNSAAGGDGEGDEEGEGGTIGSLSNVSPSADAISEQTQILVKDSNSSEYVPRNIDEIAGFNEEKLAEYLLAHEYVTKDYLHGLIFPDPENNAVRTALNLVVEGGVSFGGVSDAGGEGGGEGGTIKYPLTWSGYSSGSFDGSVSANIVIPTTLPANDVYTWAKQPSLLLSDIPDLSSKYLSLTGGTIDSTNSVPVIINTSNSTEVVLQLSQNEQLRAIVGYDIYNGSYIQNGINNRFLGIADDGTPYYHNGSYKNTLLHSGNYSDYALPKSGGVLSGNNYILTINGVDNSYILFDLNMVDRASVGYYNNLAYIASEVGGYARIGIADNGEPQYWPDYTGNTKHTLIHSGNIGEQSVASADYATNSTKLYSVDSEYAYGSQYPYYLQMRYNVLGENSWYLSVYPETPAYVSVDKARRLVTARSIWGQSFDGTENIDGAFKYGYINLEAGNEINSKDTNGTGVPLCINWQGAGNVLMVVGGGCVGIGTASPPYAKLQVEGDCLINGRNYNAISYTSDNLAYYGYDNGGIYGTIKITLPNSWNSDMSMFEIWVYEYNSMAGSKIFVSGYSYGGTYWYNTKYAVLGNYNKGVRLAHDGSKLCILLGNTSSYWVLPQIYLKARSHGLEGRVYIHSSGYSISLITDESSFSTIQNVSIADTYTNNIIASGEVTFGSDARYKNKIKDTSISLKSIAEAPLFIYRWNDRDDDRVYLGTTAQYWLDTPFKYAVNTTNPDFLGLGYGELGVAIGIVNSRKLLNHESRITTLERDKEKERLKKQLKKLQYQFRQLEKQLQQYRRALQ